MIASFWNREKVKQALLNYQEIKELLTDYNTPSCWTADPEQQKNNDGFDMVEIKRDIDAAINTLSPHYRQLVIQHYCAGITQTDISQKTPYGRRRVCALLEEAVDIMSRFLSRGVK